MSVIEIVDYRPGWVEEFGAIGAALRQALGSTARRISHIGSTSVPGQAAKDIIDVQVSVASVELDAPTEAQFEAAGFPLDDKHWTDHVPSGGPTSPAEWSNRMAKPLPRPRRINLHVREAGRANERFALLFRDYLRVDSAVADTYGLIKRELASRHGDDLDAYYAVKDPVCDLIIASAWR